MTSFQSVTQDYFISYAHIQVSASTNTIPEKSNKEETPEVQYLENDLRLLAWRGYLSPAAPVVQSAQPIWPTETRMQMATPSHMVKTHQCLPTRSVQKDSAF